jgi:hypothetical protein
MASKSDNFFTRIKENVMGTKEQNKAAQERMDAKKKKEKEAEDKTKMAKGGAVKKAFKPCEGCPSPAKCKAAGKCLKAKMAKGGLSSGKQSPAGKATKAPVLAIMIGVPKESKAKKK